jgi:hypothetical protein
MIESIIPRYEFRAFAQNFGLVVEKIRRASPCDLIRESEEWYIISPGNSENNTKIRYEIIDIKNRLQTKKGLEQWLPRLKAEFPIQTSLIQEELFPALAIEPIDWARPQFTLEQFLNEIVWPHPQLVPVRVFKRRFGFTINGCITEYAELLINGAAIQTVAVESVDIDAVLRIKTLLGLDEYENVNYLSAIKRIIGMEPYPA